MDQGIADHTLTRKTREIYYCLNLDGIQRVTRMLKVLFNWVTWKRNGLLGIVLLKSFPRKTNTWGGGGF